MIRRVLLAPQPWSQREVAEAADVSQPRVSQVLTELKTMGLVDRVHVAAQPLARWLVNDWGHLLDLWLATYPGPGGVTTYWYGLDPPNAQAEQVVQLLSEQDVSHADDVPVVSGDSGAEFVALPTSPACDRVRRARGRPQHDRPHSVFRERRNPGVDGAR